MAIANLTKCLVTGAVLPPDADLALVAGGIVSFALSRRDVDNPITIVPVPVLSTVDAEGNISVELWPNSEGVAGTFYTATLKANGITYPTWRVVVPNTASANLAAISTTTPPASVNDAQAAADAAQADAAQTALDRIATAADRVQTGLDVVSAEADRVATAADRVQTGLDRVQTGLDRVATAADVVSAEADRVATAADRVQTGLDRIATAADRIQTGLDVVSAEADRVATAADRIQTGLDVVATAADRVQTGLDVLSTAADRVQTGADVLSTVANTGVSTADKNAAAISADEAEAAAAAALVTKGLMDTALLGVTDYSNTLAQLSPAAREVVAAADVIDVFIYDTTLDSDGGAWRKRCNWTSWMKETLSTATRGARNQFPQKALIVARVGSVTIYDLDQASCPMWMVFSMGAFPNYTLINQAAPKAVVAQNGYIFVVGQSLGTDGRYIAIDFIKDETRYCSNGVSGLSEKLANRNGTAGWVQVSSGLYIGFLVSSLCNDVAATILPGTPVDRVRKLPTPTVAVATAGGVSVIHWDGRVANSSDTSSYASVLFFGKEFSIAARSGTQSRVDVFRSSAFYVTAFAISRSYAITSSPMVTSEVALAAIDRGFVSARAGSSSSLFQGISVLRESLGNPAAGAVCSITSKYNTGYMVGNTKLALAESTADLTSLVQGTTDFVNNTEHWTDPTPVIVNTGGSAGAYDNATNTMSNPGSSVNDHPRFGFNLPGMVIGKRYQVSGVLTGDISKVFSVRLATIGSANNLSYNSVTGVISGVAAAAFGGIQILLSLISGSESVTISSLSIKEVVTTVLYDDFGGYADTAAMAAAGWTQGANTTMSLEAGTKIKVLNVGTNNGIATKAIAGLIVGQRYKITANLLTISAGFGRVGAFYTATIQTVAERSSPGEVSGTFLATHTTMYLSLWNRNDNNAYSEWGDIRVDRVANDRSVAANHPLVYGTVTRTAVASGAELAAYGGFSASNYLETGASAITLGTGDFCFSAWAYYGAIGGAIGQETLFAIQGTNELRLDKVSGTTFISISQVGRFTGTNSTVALTANAWNHVAFVRSGSTMNYFINGVLAGTSTMPSYDGALTSGTIRIGNRSDGVTNHKQQIALARAGLTAPTPQQIRDMYAAEAPLFQANAKCLLPADSVSALAYDDSTNLLHVATTSGMARLNDLLVVDKDAIVVTGIDARSGIVVTRDANSADVTQPSLLMRAELLQPDMRTPYDRDRARGSGVTINATPTIIGRIPFDKGEHHIAEVRVRANQYADGAAYGRYVRRALIDRPEEGNIALVGSVETSGTDGEGTGTQDIGLTVNTTTQTLDITATGLASTNIEWTWEAVLS